MAIMRESIVDTEQLNKSMECDRCLLCVELLPEAITDAM